MPGQDKIVILADQFAVMADHILTDLDLLGRLASVGRPVRIGSSAAGMMVVRDIDIGVLCPVLDTSLIFPIAQSLFEHPHVKRVNLVDERGSFQSMSGPEDEGIYCGIRYYEEGTRSEAEWKIDVWFFPEAAPRPEIVIRDRLLNASLDERGAILRIKRDLVEASRYGTDIHGIDIYRAVLDRGVRSIAEFDRLPRDQDERFR